MRPMLERVTEQTLPEVTVLYDAVHTQLERGPNGPGWRRGVYPTPADAQAGFEAQTLYLMRDEDSRLAAATVILNRDQPPQYADARWLIPAAPRQVTVVHTFMVHPGFARRGFGARTLEAAHALARETGSICMRLDTYERNSSAIALYEKMGYRMAGLIDLGFAQYGLDWYRAYELML